MLILVTGGIGYIGSHTCISLFEAGHDLLVLDSLANSNKEVLDRIESISGNRPGFIKGDVRDQRLLRTIFENHPIAAVVHFAGLKSVAESVAKPLEYYDINVQGTLKLLSAMQEARVKTLVFSSSATVYGTPSQLPVTEDHPRSPTNPYGRSKSFVEEILLDLQAADPDWRIACLRYFNPVGAHHSGLIGEEPLGMPGNLMPHIAKVAVGKAEFVNIWGGDYPTPDGTGVRDYIHVMDLAEGHVAALAYLSSNFPSILTVNLGCGRGYSVLEMVKAFESACGRSIPYKISARRPGDVAACWANPLSAQRLLGWRARRGLDEMCADTWRWQTNSLDTAHD